MQGNWLIPCRSLLQSTPRLSALPVVSLTSQLRAHSTHSARLVYTTTRRATPSIEHSAEPRYCLTAQPFPHLSVRSLPSAVACPRSTTTLPRAAAHARTCPSARSVAVAAITTQLTRRRAPRRKRRRLVHAAAHFPLATQRTARRRLDRGCPAPAMPVLSYG